MELIRTGRVWKYGSDINTDIISPPAYMELPIAQAAKYAMSPVDPQFGPGVQPGDLLVAEHNLGSGSSRETAPLTLKELGIGAVIACSYARIFYRNCINIGLLALECRQADRICAGDQLRIDLGKSIICNLSRDESYPIAPIPEHILHLIAAGGLIPYLERFKLNQQP